MPLGEVQLQPAPARKAGAARAARVAVVRRVVRLEGGERGQRVRAAVHAAAERVDSARIGADSRHVRVRTRKETPNQTRIEESQDKTRVENM